MASESALSAIREQEVYDAVPQEPQGPPEEEAVRLPPGALIPRQKFRWQPLVVAGSTVLSVLIILAVLLLPRHRPAAPRPPRPEVVVVAGAVQAEPPQMYINEEPPQAMPVPLRLYINGKAWAISPAHREGAKWTTTDAGAGAWWEVGSVVPYRVLLRQAVLEEDGEAVLVLSSGREERFRPGAPVGPTAPGLVVILDTGQEVAFAAAQELDPNAVPTPQPTPTPMPTTTPPVPPEVVGAVAEGDTVILRLRWNGIPPQGAGAVCRGKEMPTVVSAANGMVEIAIPHCSPPAIVDVGGFVFAIE